MNQIDRDVLEAITEVFYDYAEAADAGDPVAFASHFTDDCRFDRGEVAPGRDWLARYAAKVLGQFTATSHHITQLRLREFDGVTATVTGYCYAHHRLRDGNTFLALSRYRSKLRIDEGRWRFFSHDIVVADNIGTDGRDYLRLERADPREYLSLLQSPLSVDTSESAE